MPGSPKLKFQFKVKQLRRENRKFQRQKYIFRFEALDMLRKNLFAENGLPNQTQKSYMDRLKTFKVKLEKQVNRALLMEQGVEIDEYVEKIETMIGDVNQKIMMEMETYVEDLNATISGMSLKEGGIDQSPRIDWLVFNICWRKTNRFFLEPQISSKEIFLNEF